MLQQNTLNDMSGVGNDIAEKATGGAVTGSGDGAAENAAAQAKISVRDLNFFYGKHHALHNIMQHFPVIVSH